MNKELRTEILIDRTPEEIWAVLINFADYPIWNPFIVTIDGNVAVGHRIKVVPNSSHSKKMTFKPFILTLNTNREFRWLGKLWVKGLFDGEHSFEIIDNGNGTCNFIQSGNLQWNTSVYAREAIRHKCQRRV